MAQLAPSLAPTPARGSRAASDALARSPGATDTATGRGLGGLRAGERGLYVSTGCFAKEARYEADRATVSVRLLNLDDFVRYNVEVYDKADDETRSILPLARIWWSA